MEKILVESPDAKKLDELDVISWPIWQKEVSRFEWSYDEKEICYFLEGKVQVETEHGDQVIFGAGDLVTFPKGLSCIWDIKIPVRKHYKLG